MHSCLRSTAPELPGGWYLTSFACLASFGLHLRKRSLDSITADLVDRPRLPNRGSSTPHQSGPVLSRKSATVAPTSHGRNMQPPSKRPWLSLKHFWQ